MDFYDFGGFNDNFQLPNHYSFNTGEFSFELQMQDSIIPHQLVVDYEGGANAVFAWERTSSGLFSESVMVDVDGDGYFDLAAEDFNGDFWPDIVSVDVDGPGGHSYSAPTSSAGLVSFLDEGITSGVDAWAALDSLTSGPVANQSATGFFDNSFETTADSVSQWSNRWHPQAAVDSCAVCCQEYIIEAATGRDISESQMLDVATDLGVYQSGFGTLPQDMGAVLDHFGIDNSVQSGVAFEDLISLVNSGHGVSIAVDGNEIMGKEDWLENWSDIWGVPSGSANHAIQVTGFESTNSGDFVIVNDPGHQNGCANRVPVNQFLHAWSDSGNLACVTNERVV